MIQKIKNKLNYKSFSNLSQVYIKQLGVTFFTRIISVIISLLYVPLVLGYLSQEKYGVWIALTTVVNWIRLFDVGVGNGLRVKLASAIVLNQLEEGKKLVSTTYAVLGGVFMLALFIILLINPFLNWNGILNTNIISANELYILTNIVISFIVIGFIVQTVSIVYAAHGNSAMGGIMQLIISLLSLILVWVATLFATPENIILLSFILTGTPVLIYLGFSFYVFGYKYPHLKPSFSQIRFRESSELFKLSSQFFVVQITATILFSSIPFVVTQLFGPKEVTQFNVASSIFNLPIMLITLVTAPMLPLVSQAYAKGDNSWISSMLKKMNYIAFATVFGTVLLTLAAPNIYHIWLGGKVQIPQNLSIAVGVYTVINVLVTPFSTFLNGIGKVKILVILAPVGIAMFIGSSVILSWWLKDVFAVSIALSLTSLVGLFVVPITLKRHIKA